MVLYRSYYTSDIIINYYYTVGASSGQVPVFPAMRLYTNVRGARDSSSFCPFSCLYIDDNKILSGILYILYYL